MNPGWIPVLWSAAAVLVVFGMYLGTRFADVPEKVWRRIAQRRLREITALERQLEELQAELNNSTWRTREMSPN